MSWKARLFVSPVVQRLVPDWLAFELTTLFARLQWRFDARRRERALRDVAQLLEDTPLIADLERHARRHLSERALREVMIWRPWMYGKAKRIDVENVVAAHEQGNGVILMAAHLGANSLGQTSNKHSAGHGLNIFTGPWLNVEAYVGYGGHRALTIKRRAEKYGIRWVTTPGAFPVLADRLSQNELAAIPFDVPGDHETIFLGKRAWLRTGIAQLALATGAQIVPTFTGRNRWRTWVRYGPPIDPADFDGLDDLMEHLAELVSAEILSRPGEREAFDYLMMCWNGPVSEQWARLADEHGVRALEAT